MATTPDALIAGVELWIPSISLTVSDGYPAPLDGWEPEQDGGTRDQARVFGVSPLYLRRPPDRSTARWAIGLEAEFIYPRNKTSRAVMLVDAVTIFDAFRRIHFGLAELSSPITGVCLSRSVNPAITEPVFDYGRVPHHAALVLSAHLEFEHS